MSPLTWTGWDYSFISDERVKTQQHFPWKSRKVFDPVILRGLQGCSPTRRGLPIGRRETLSSRDGEPPLRDGGSGPALGGRIWRGLTQGCCGGRGRGVRVAAGGAGEGQEKQAMALAGVTQLHPRRPPAAPSLPHSTQVNLLDSFVHEDFPDPLTWMGIIYSFVHLLANID